MDTARDAWSIASGNYSSRFAPPCAARSHLAADADEGEARAQRRGAAQCAGRMRSSSRAGECGAKGNPDNALPFGRVAAAAHWSPGTLAGRTTQALRETVFWTPPQLTAPTEDDEINSSLCHGFIFDFCGVEVDRITGAVRIDKYVTMHDCGTRAASRHGGGADHRRLRACARRRALRGIRLLGRRQLSVRHVRRLSGADHDRSAGAADPARRDAVAVHAARRQGRRRGQLHEHAGVPRQCGGRCAGRRRHRPAADAEAARCRCSRSET